MESSVEFVCCDNPHATRLLLHMLAAFAEHERATISECTKSRACRCEGPRCPAWQSSGGGSPRPGQSFTPCPPLKPPQHPARRWPCMARQHRHESSCEHPLPPPTSARTASVLQ